MVSSTHEIDVIYDESKNIWQFFFQGKNLKTRAGHEFFVATEKLANLYQQEWNAISGKYKQDKLSFQHLIFTALDKIALDSSVYIAELVNYASTDLLLFHQGYPQSLKEREAEIWFPYVSWFNAAYQTNFEPCYSLASPEHRQEDLLKVEEALKALEPFSLSAIYALTQLTGSLLLSMAFYHHKVDVAGLREASQLPENYQAEKWGQDEELTKAQEKFNQEISLIDSYFKSL